MAVMVIDDDPLVLRTLTRTLSEFLDTEVVGVSDGYEAIATYEERSADVHVVVIDLSLPELDGATTLRTLRRIDDDLTIIAITGLPVPDAREAAAKLGADLLVRKPFLVEEIVEFVQDVLASRQVH